MSVPNGIWDKPGPLDLGERERVRLHAYYTERVLWQAAPLRPAASIACSAHERLDGAGYHRSLAAAAIPRTSRILAVADAVAAMRAARAHRAPLRRDAICRELQLDAKIGKLDRAVVDAAIDAAGLGAGPGGGAPRGVAPRATDLSARELDVLRWVARGKSNKEIGAILGISSRTVKNHVAHLYDKAGVSSRAGAALYAVERGLLDDGE